jgi:Vitamin B6 photo-protection and homoeostasis
MPLLLEGNLDMSVLQFEFDASVLTNNHRHSSHHRQHRRQCLLCSKTSRTSSSTSPPLASISAKVTNLPSTTAAASIAAKETNANTSNAATATVAAPAPAGTILPVGLKRGPHPRRYLWDGHRLVAVELSDLESVSSAASALATNSNNNNRKRIGNKKGVFVPLPSLEHALARWLHSARAAFFPHPDEVTPDYWEWCKWRATHRIFSSMASVFGTQSLLLAVGVGAKRTLPASAAINWVLKDGLGRVGRLSVATKFGESFDSDLKRFRFSSSLLYATSLSLDFLTPLFPQYFLPMASIANVGKSVGLTTYISTQPAFHRSFAVSENLADISAKSQAQQMAVDTLGLAVAVTLSALCARHSESARRALPLLAFPILAGGDLLAISNELRSIHLRTLNKERAEIIAAEFVESGKVATPENVSAKERLILPPECSLGVLPLSFGGLEEVLTTGEEVEKFLKNTIEDVDGVDEEAAGQGARKRTRRVSSSVFGGRCNKSSSSNNTDFSHQKKKKKKYALKVILPPISDHVLNDESSRHYYQKKKSKMIKGTSADTALPPSSSSLLYFFDVVSDIKKWIGIGKSHRGAVHAALRTDASPEDVLEIILCTAKLRRNLGVLGREESKNNYNGNDTSRSAVLKSVEVPSEELQQFINQLRAAGWQVAPFLLSSAEKKFYCEMK